MIKDLFKHFSDLKEKSMQERADRSRDLEKSKEAAKTVSEKVKILNEIIRSRKSHG